MSRSSYDTSAAGSWGSAFAGVMLLVVGVCQFLQGLVAVINGNTFYVTTPQYIFQLNVSAWGWIHLIIGIVVAVAGYFIFTGNVVARGFGMVLAGAQAIVNFMWLPSYPLWSLVIIAIDVFVIWSLATTRLTQRV
ncbi:MAG TPA: hypothetical protein VFT68_01615 [Lapillicoccus sp.]|nr:hypothetical protein [Lapillicoccus sp.]